MLKLVSFIVRKTMSTSIPSELQQFRDFVDEKLTEGETELSIEEALRMFRSADVQESSAGDSQQGISWTDENNRRRSELVDKEISGTLTNEEREELDKLQKEMRAYRNQVAPLPLDDLRKAHDELLRKANHSSN